jgi:hypothetical protein
MHKLREVENGPNQFPLNREERGPNETDREMETACREQGHTGIDRYVVRQAGASSET